MQKRNMLPPPYMITVSRIQLVSSGLPEKFQRKLGYTLIMNIEQMVNELFDVFDENKDGVISRREFIALAEDLLNEKGIGFTSDIFNQFDANHDNAISRQELVDMIVELAL